MIDGNDYNWQSISGPVPEGKTRGEWVTDLMRRYLDGKAAIAEVIRIGSEEGVDVENHPVVVEGRATLRIAREALIAANVGLVVYHVGRIVYGRVLRESRDDAIQVGLIALARAVDKYDDRGTQFSTYASRIIINALKRWAGVEYFVLSQTAQLDEDLLSARHSIRDDEADRWEAHELAVECAAAVIDNECGLDEKERDVLIGYFGLGEGIKQATATLQGIGDRYGLTKERIRQVRNRALAKVAATIDGRRN